MAFDAAAPGGEFTLGTNEDLEKIGEKYQHWWKPEHRVRLSPYWIGKYPVTNDQYSRFLVQNPDAPKPVSWDDKRFNQPEQPVVGVSWTEAAAYCEWAGLELPTEARWEAAARGTYGRPFPWGSELPSGGHADYGKKWKKDAPAAVGTHPLGAGPYGTLDQAGTVWEWCVDAWNERAYQDRDGQNDPIVRPRDESSDTADRVVRGGAWVSPSWGLRAAIRNRVRAGYRYQDVGFRVMIGLGPSPP